MFYNQELRRILKNFRFVIGSLFIHSDTLFFFYRLRRSVFRRTTNSDSQLCLEGYQRSGNSYLYMCLSISNPLIRVGHHIHGIAHVRYALKRQIPVVVLIREPAASLASLLTWDNRLLLGIALGSYIRFHRQLKKLKSEVLIINFVELITDVDAVIRKINKRYELELDCLNLTEAQLSERMRKRQALYAHSHLMPFPNSHKNELNYVNKKLIEGHELFTVAKTLFDDISLSIHE